MEQATEHCACARAFEDVCRRFATPAFDELFSAHTILDACTSLGELLRGGPWSTFPVFVGDDIATDALVWALRAVLRVRYPIHGQSIDPSHGNHVLVARKEGLHAEDFVLNCALARLYVVDARSTAVRGVGEAAHRIGIARDPLVLALATGATVPVYERSTGTTRHVAWTIPTLVHCSERDLVASATGSFEAVDEAARAAFFRAARPIAVRRPLAAPRGRAVYLALAAEHDATDVCVNVCKRVLALLR